MKKFLSALIAVLVSVVVLPQIVFAADVPSFFALGSGNIALTLKPKNNTKLDHKTYGYLCNPNMTQNFIQQYTTRLLNSGLFEITNQFTRKLGSKGHVFEVIQFKYIGSKKVSSFGVVDRSKCNLAIVRVLTVNENTVLVYIPIGLDFEDENLPTLSEMHVSPEHRFPAGVLPANKIIGADVPDFAQVGAYYKKSQLNGDKSTLYFYGAKNLNADLSNDYVGKYIRLLKGKYHFVQVAHEQKKWGSPRLQKNRPTDIWKFRYTGSKNVWALSNGSHLEIKRIRELDKGVVSFEVKVAHGLIMAGNHGAPKQSSGGGDTFCSYCSGSGKCTSCGGTGYYEYTIDYQKPCEVCLTSGKCVYCNGTGKE